MEVLILKADWLSVIFICALFLLDIFVLGSYLTCLEILKILELLNQTRRSSSGNQIAILEDDLFLACSLNWILRKRSTFSVYLKLQRCVVMIKVLF